ncbi:MAG: septum formation initiator family protein [Pseudomonadota bacterium]
MGRFVKLAINVAAPVVALSGVMFFTIGGLWSASGYSELRRLERDARQIRNDVDALTAKREALQRRAALLNPTAIDPDLFDERARSVLGFVEDDDIVMPRRELERLAAERAAAAGERSSAR